MHTKLCKILLGVHQKTSNIATRAELGRYPIMITILANIISYRARLENLEQSGLLYESFKDDKLLNSKGLTSWYSCSEEILKLTNLNLDTMSKVSTKTIRKRVIIRLKQSYDIFFRQSIFNDQRKDPCEQNKLRTFRKFKQTIKYERYLDIDFHKETLKKYTQLRLSSHKLQIELARYIKVPKTQRKQEKDKARICKNCNLDKIEDELHFLMICPQYQTERIIFFNGIYEICRNASLLSKEQLFIWLLSNEDQNIAKKVIRFVKLCCDKRKS